MAVALRFAARSDVGLVRSNNQDSAYAGPHLLVVADGMGGHAGGDVASSIVVGELSGLDGDSHGANALPLLEETISLAHEDLVARVKDEPALSGMGTTVTALLRSGNRLALAHIGDSRGYLLRDDALTQVTTDHTFVQHLVDSGRISPEEAERHPQRSVLLRVLGDIDADVVPDTSMREIIPGDRWLLCSDGLSGVVSPETIEDTLRSTPDVGNCADTLIELALKGGAPDNVTCIVADVVDLTDEDDGTPPSTTPQIVGSAAIRRNVPTRAHSGPAARAASLGKKTTPDGEVVDDEISSFDPHTRLRKAGWIMIIIGALALIVAGLLGGYSWTQSQYYVGVSGNEVAIYKGIPQTIGPWALSEVVEESSVTVSDLPDYVQTRVKQTISASSLTDARSIITNITGDLPDPESMASPTESPEPTQSPRPIGGQAQPQVPQKGTS